MMKLILLILIVSISSFSQERKLSIFGMTVHGLDSNYDSVKEMKNKLSYDGRLALNPQLNFTFYKNNQITNYSFVIDCYAHPAAYLGNGKIYQVDENLKLGYMFGVYIRQFPRNELFTFGKVGNYQIIPTPSLILEYSLNKKLSLRVNSNYVINFVDLAFNF